MGERGKGGRDWGSGISRGKLTHVRTDSKVLLHSTGNYIQFPVKNHSRIECMKQYA